MHLLLDTHALILWMSDNAALPKSARAAILDQRNTIFVSAASAWEMATKVRLGRLPVASEILRDFHEYMIQSRFESLSITTAHGLKAGHLPGPQMDPFDRMLIAQAQMEDLMIVSNETTFDSYGVRRIW